MSTERTPAHVVIGRTGARRRAAIERLLDERAHEGRWAVLQQASLTADCSAARSGVIYDTAAAGCMCCVGQVGFRVSLARLLRTARPTAVVIEVIADQHQERVLALLEDEWFGAVIRVAAVHASD